MAIGADDRSPVADPALMNAELLGARRGKNGRGIGPDPDDHRPGGAFDFEILLLFDLRKVDGPHDFTVHVDIEDVGIAAREKERQKTKADDRKGQDSKVKADV